MSNQTSQSVDDRRIAEAAAAYQVGHYSTPVIISHLPAKRRVNLPEMQAILPLLYDTLDQTAKKKQMPVTQIRLRVSTSPEEGEQELVVEQWVKASATEANAYWAELEDELIDRLNSLSDGLRNYIYDNISVSVRWDNDGLPF